MATVKRTKLLGAEYLSNLMKMKNATGKAGWFKGNNEANGTSTAYVAAIQEFGAHTGGGGKNGIYIPPRPFMRPTISENQSKWHDDFKKGVRAISRGGQSMGTVMEQITAQVVGQIKRTITSISTPPLSPVTLLLRSWKKGGRKIGRTQVGWAASIISKGIVPEGQYYESNNHPLLDTKHMYETVTNQVEHDGGNAVSKTNYEGL